MKIVNEKGKLFGIINIVDLLVILLIVAIVGGVGWQLLGTKVQNSVAPQVTVVTEVDIFGAAPRIYNEVERQELIGQRIVSGNSYMDATITDVWLEDYVVQVPTADGPIVDAKDPTKKNIVVQITSKAAKGTASPAIGSQELRAGKTYIVKTQTFECSGTIRYVEMAD